MKRTRIADTVKTINETITIAGWIDAVRDHKKVVFLTVHDRSAAMQVVLEKNDPAFRPQTVIEITGRVKERPKGSEKKDMHTGLVELEAQEYTILAESAELPVDIALPELNATIETLLDYRPLTLRHPKIKAIFRVQNIILYSFRSFLKSQGFTEFQAPRILAGDAEGGASVMKVDYLGYQASLAQSPQLYKQIMVGVFERVFTVGNVFRGEPHSTTRHINEYTSMDFEMGFIESHLDVMRMENDWLLHLEKELRAHAADIFKMYNVEIPVVPKDIPAITFCEAREIIKTEFGENMDNEIDLSPQHERWLCEYVKKKWDSEFVFITEYPTAKRPFYTYLKPGDPDYTMGFDLLFRGLEITTGGRRIEDYNMLLARMEAKGVEKKDFEFYLQAFKYGMPPHGGLGFGLERMTALLLGLQNVREATAFPRDINRIDLPLNRKEE